LVERFDHLVGVCKRIFFLAPGNRRGPDLIVQFYEDVPGLSDGQLLHLIPWEEDYDQKIIKKLDAEGLVDMTAYPPGDQEDLIDKPWPEVPFSPFVYVEFPHGPFQPQRFFKGDHDDYTTNDFPDQSEVLAFMREVAYARELNVETVEFTDVDDALDFLDVDSLRIDWDTFYPGPGTKRRD